MKNHPVLSLIAGMVCLSGWCAAATFPAPPAPQHEVFPEFKINDSAAARKLFVPMWDSLPVDWVATGDSGYVRLPMNFKGTTHTRCCWDLPIKADLTSAQGIEFDICCEDFLMCAQTNVYCHCPGGWYAAGFGVKRLGKWFHVEVEKGNFKTEGKPEGWGKIDTIRISSWRHQSERDGEIAIANLAPIRVKPEVAIIMAYSCLKANNPENSGYQSYAAQFQRTLKLCGVQGVLYSDLEDVASVLAQVQLAVLPYNPRVPENVLTELQAFVGRGGRLIVCYSLTEGIGKLLGVKHKSWTQARKETFKGMAATADRLVGQPDLAEQYSPHTVVVEPTGEGRVVAKWQESDGTDSGLPAITVTPTGAFVGHVWTGADAAGKPEIMFALLNHLSPKTLVPVGDRMLANAGQVGTYANYAEARAVLAADGSAAVKAELAQADAALAKAKTLHAAQDWSGLLASCSEVRKHLTAGLCLQAKPVKGEHRAFWCHSAFGLPGMTWDEAIGFLKSNGFNVIHPNMCWGGLAYYPSEVLPAYGDLAEKGDQLRQCLDACRRHGVECHVWKVNWNMGSRRDKAFAERMKAEKRTMVTATGEEKDAWLCPSNPLNRRLEADAMVELVRNYPDMTGIHFDYIRYSDASVCFCDGCRQRFEAKIGQAVANWPADVRDGALKSQWLQFRRDQISALVKLVHDEAKAVRPNIQISGALFSNWPADRDGVGQDWEMWCREGWLDFACPMDYTDYVDSFAGKAQMQKAWVHNVPLYPGIGLSCWRNPRDPLNMIAQIEAVRKLGLKGFTVFNYDSHARYVLPFLKLGCTRE